MGATKITFLLCDNNPEELHRAGVWAADMVLAHPELDAHTELAELLRALGLMRDPDARDRRALSKITTLRGDTE